MEINKRLFIRFLGCSIVGRYVRMVNFPEAAESFFSMSDPNMYYLWLVFLSIFARTIFILRPLTIIAKRFGGVKSIMGLWKDFRNEFNPSLKPVYLYIIYEVVWTILPLIPLIILRFGFLPDPVRLDGSFDEMIVLIPCAIAWIGMNFIVIFKAGDPIDKTLKILNKSMIKKGAPKFTRWSIILLNRSRGLMKSISSWSDKEYLSVKPNAEFEDVLETRILQQPGDYTEERRVVMDKVYSNLKEAGRVGSVIGQNSIRMVMNQVKRGAKAGSEALDNQVNHQIEKLFKIEKNRWDRIVSETVLNFLPLFAIYILLPIFA